MNIRIELLIVVSALLSVIGFAIGRLSTSAATFNRESRLVDSIVLDTVYCRTSEYERRKRLAVHLALFDYLAFGGKAPADGSGLDLLLEFIEKKVTEGEVRDCFSEEIAGVEQILSENCVVEDNQQALFVIAGGSPFVVRDYRGAEECVKLLKEIEDDFVQYLNVAVVP